MADRDIDRGEDLTDPAEARADQPTVQLLVENEGNRRAIRTMLDDHYHVETGQSVRDADLYLVESRVFPRYSDDLRAVVEAEYPVFCPVVLVRRDGNQQIALPDASDLEAPLLVDDVLEAPLSRALLIRRLNTLLVRREQAQQLQSQVSTLEERERELRSFKQAVEYSGHSITITETDGTIRYVNSAFEETTGYSAEEAIGKNPRILKSGEHGKDFYADLWGTILDGEVWDGDVINERKNGDRYVVEQTIAPILDDGDIEGFVSVNSEVTDWIRRQRELQRHRQELELLRQILTRVLRHNIRNDLNVVLGHAQRLEEESEGDTEGLSKIVENAKAIAETSETARELAALIERSESPSRQDVATIAELVVDEARDRFPDTTFVLDAPDGCVAYASSELQRAVTELVENAAEHNGSEDPQVRLTVEQDETIRLVVEDNGQGIPENELVPLREDEETALKHGSSVDLWLVDLIVDQSSGSIHFDSDESGTRIELELPREEVDRSDLSPFDGNG